MTFTIFKFALFTFSKKWNTRILTWLIIKWLEQVAKLKRTWNLASVLQIVQKIPENYWPCLYLSTGQDPYYHVEPYCPLTLIWVGFLGVGYNPPIFCKGVPAPPFLRHLPLNPASPPLFKIFVSPPLFSVPSSFKVF